MFFGISLKVRLSFLFFFIGLLFIQSYLLQGIIEYRPNFILMIVIFAGLFFGKRVGTEMGAYAGILSAIFSVGFGYYFFVLFVLFGWLSGLFCQKLDRENVLVQFFLVAFFSLFFEGFLFLVRTCMVAGYNDYSFFVSHALKDAVVNGVISPLIFALFRMWPFFDGQVL